MGIINRIHAFFKNYLYNPKWKCNWCGKEIFNEAYFCEDCKNKLPYNDTAICDHCGRKLTVGADYCTTCKGRLTSLDKCRSAFYYAKPISTLIKNAKYDNKRYILEYFAEYMSLIYFKNYFNADVMVYVPMTEKAELKRGYNQSRILAEKLSELINVPIVEAISKKNDTKRQAKLNRLERMKNLEDAFKVTNKKEIRGKKVLIVDDVTTTGATAENISIKLKKAGADAVYLLTIASVSPKEKY